MLRILQILVNAVILGCSVVSLLACGQQGPLYLPTEPTAKKQTESPEKPLRSSSTNSGPTQAVSTQPAAPAASPVSP
ncbi:lipoprotein [Rhodoferax sp.]|uniref:LPS translocon maturation chaperone LptM n=1 Tax=Rhodoferax sp. TaxID=50421 RepID=UPI003427402C